MKSSSIIDRAHRSLSKEGYNAYNYPEYVGTINLFPPEHRQYILRMLIRRPGDPENIIPEELDWVRPLIDKADLFQRECVRVNHPYRYLTIRSGEVSSTNDDTWHVDGFSLRFNHLPEQNYIWCNTLPTEYVAFPVDLSNGFDPMKHNIHLLFQDVLENNVLAESLEAGSLYCLDPYVIHRRPKNSTKSFRTMVRYSHVPIPIDDINNTSNPLLDLRGGSPMDRVRDFRDHLGRFETM
jgi:hypothetical protein